MVHGRIEAFLRVRQTSKMVCMFACDDDVLDIFSAISKYFQARDDDCLGLLRCSERINQQQLSIAYI
jgi:hypothetical protein